MAETKQKKERIVSLDLIRAVCPLMIVIYHFAAEAAALNLPYIQPLMNSVRFETTLFFMVSGASLMMSQGGDGFSLKTYVKKRFFAIYPMYYIAWIGAYLAFSFASHHLIVHDFRTLPLTLIGFDGYFTGILDTWFTTVGEWFLGPLVFCYVVFPLLRLGVRKWKGVLFGVLLVAEVILAIFDVISLRSLLVATLSFTIGMELQNIRAWLEKKPWMSAISLTVLVVYLIFFQWIPPYYASAQIISVLIFLTLTCIEVYLKKGLQKAKWLSNIISFLSGLSYPLYLIQHLVVLFVLKKIPSFFTKQWLGINWTGLDTLLLILALCIIGAFVFNTVYKFLAKNVRLLFQRKSLRSKSD